MKRHELYSAMTEEERGLFDELQDEIGKLKRLLADNDGTAAESKVSILCICFLLNTLYCKTSHFC